MCVHKYKKCWQCCICVGISIAVTFFLFSRRGATMYASHVKIGKLQESATLTESNNDIRAPLDSYTSAFEVDVVTTRHKRRIELDDKMTTDSNISHSIAPGVKLTDEQNETMPKRRRIVESSFSPAILGIKWRAIMDKINDRDDLMSYPWESDVNVNIDSFFAYRYSEALSTLKQLTQVFRSLLACYYAPFGSLNDNAQVSAFVNQLYELNESVTPDRIETSKPLNIAIHATSLSVYYISAHFRRRESATPRYIELITMAALKMDELLSHLTALTMLFSTNNSHIIKRVHRL